jgi:SAM-dependent methyltransferase
MDQCKGEETGVKSRPSNINTQAYWDRVYFLEIGKAEWRRYLLAFGKIKTYLGVCAAENSRVLELGCGYGKLFDHLSSLKLQLTGWDISEVAVKHLVSKGYEARQVDFRGYVPQPKDMYDYVVATEFIEHFESLEPILLKMWSMAGKAIVLTFPDGILPNEECKEHLSVLDGPTISTLTERWDVKRRYIEPFVEEFVFIDAEKTPTLVRLPSVLAIIERANP